MDDFPERLVFPAVVIGPAALRCIGSVQSGRVIAVFDSTFYIAVGNRLICIANRNVGRGPLNIVTQAPSGTNWSACGVRVRMPAWISPSEIRVDNRFVFPLSRCDLWSPNLRVDEVVPDRARIGIDALRLATATCAPDEGLGRLLACGATTICDNPIAAAAAPLIASARTWVAQTLASVDSQLLCDAAWIREMTGLGPGLTPSGDDFLGGMMVTLHMLDEVPTARLLWRKVEPFAQRDGNHVSLAHLAAAAEGLCAESVERTISAVLRGDRHALHARRDATGWLGHSSGWESLAGAGAAPTGWLDQQSSLLTSPRNACVQTPTHG